MWPTAAQKRQSIRLLDCTKEQDYGPHIVEDRSTGQLHGKTPAGIFHITILGLNDRYFIEKRQERTALLRLSQNSLIIGAHPYPQLIEDVRAAVALLTNMIPELPEA
jgi:hypothetical protein